MTALDTLYRVADVVAAHAAALDTTLPAVVQVHAHVLPTDARAPYVLVEGGAPHPTGPPMAGDQRNDVDVRTVSVGRSMDEAVMLADQVRAITLGRTADGPFAHPITVAGRTVADRTGADDGHPDIVAGLPQWTEGYTLTVVRA